MLVCLVCLRLTVLLDNAFYSLVFGEARHSPVVEPAGNRS